MQCNVCKLKNFLHSIFYTSRQAQSRQSRYRWQLWQHTQLLWISLTVTSMKLRTRKTSFSKYLTHYLPYDFFIFAFKIYYFFYKFSIEALWVDGCFGLYGRYPKMHKVLHNRSCYMYATLFVKIKNLCVRSPLIC